MTRSKTTIMTKTLPTEIFINGQKIHGGTINMKYAPPKGGIIPNQTFIHGTPYVGYVPNVQSDLYGKNGVNGLGVAFGTGIFDWIPIVGPILGKVTGLGVDKVQEIENVQGGFPWLAAIPAVLSGIDLIKGLFKGNGMIREAQICERPGQPCDITFRTGHGLYRTRANLNGMHKALLIDQPFLHQLHSDPMPEARGIAFPGQPRGRGIQFRKNPYGGDVNQDEHGNLIYPDNLEKYEQAGQEMNGLVGLGFQDMKNINKV